MAYGGADPNYTKALINGGTPQGRVSVGADFAIRGDKRAYIAAKRRWRESYRRRNRFNDILGGLLWRLGTVLVIVYIWSVFNYPLWW